MVKDLWNEFYISIYVVSYIEYHFFMWILATWFCSFNRGLLSCFIRISSCVNNIFNIVVLSSEKDLFESAQKVCARYKIAKNGDNVIITTGSTDKISNMMKLETIK